MPWSLETLKGYPNAVKDQIQSNDKLPSSARDYLLRLMDESVPIPLIVTIDAHGHELRNSYTGGVTRHIVITLTAI